MNTIKKIIFCIIASVVFFTTACEEKDLAVVVEGVMLDTMSLYLVKDFPGYETYTLKATVFPENATNQDIVWTSSNNDVATVNNGLIQAVSPGEAKIFVTTVDGGFRMQCLVLVFNKPIDVEGVSFPETSITMLLGRSRTLLPDIIWQPNDPLPTDRYLRWVSDDPETVSVTPRGLIDALRVGTTTIRATARSSAGLGMWYHFAEIEVNVVPAPIYPTDITINRATVDLAFGADVPDADKIATLTATLIPATVDADKRTIEWESSDPTIVKVESTGATTATITALKIGGPVEIIAIAKDGEEGEIRSTATVVNVLRYYGPNTKFLALDADLKAEIENAANHGATLVLPVGYVFTVPDGGTIQIGGPVTVIGNLDGPRAVVRKLTDNPGSFFNFTSTASGVIAFENVEFDRGSPLEVGLPGTYMFNMNSEFGTVAKLSYKNVRMANFGRNFFRVQGSANGIIEELEIDDCEFYRMGIGNGGDYAFLHIDVANVTIHHINIRNSTFNINGCHFIFFGQDRSTSQRGCKSITIENCTFYEALTSGSDRWFINTRNAGDNPENTHVTLRNLILGSTGRASSQGYRNDQGGTNTVENVFITQSWFANNAIPGTTLYEGTAADLFVDPAAGNFRIKDASFPGATTAGDPRWR